MVYRLNFLWKYKSELKIILSPYFSATHYGDTIANLELPTAIQSSFWKKNIHASAFGNIWGVWVYRGGGSLN